MEEVKLLSVLPSSLPSWPFNNRYNGQRMSKSLICQDDSLSIYQAFSKAPLFAAAGSPEQTLNPSCNLHIDRYDVAAFIGNECEEISSSQVLI